jgi:Na+/melibiose symporter-like transporter
MGSLGTGLFSTVPGFLLLYFMTQVLHVRPALAGVAVFAPKIWSVVTDPAMGVISDRTRSKLGRRRPYILAAALMLPALFALLFSPPPHLGETGDFLFELAIYGLGATAYAVFSVPYLSMPSEMSDDPHFRTKIMSFRMGFVMVGIMLGMAAAPALVDKFGGGRAGYSRMAVTLGAMCAAAMMTTFFSTSAFKSRATGDDRQNFLLSLKSVLVHTQFRDLAIAYGLQMIGASLFGAVAPYFVTQILRQSLSNLGLIFLTMLTASLVAMPAWTISARRLGKMKSYRIATLLYAASAAGLICVSPASAWQIYANVVMVGIAFGGIQLLPFSLLTDVIHSHGLQNSVWNEGIFTGVWTSAEKASLATGPLAAGLILSFTGFVTTSSGLGSQPPASSVAIRLLFSVVPAVLVAVSYLVLGRYRIGGTRAPDNLARPRENERAGN